MSGVLRIRRDGLTWRAVNGELVALDLERSVYLASNSSGSTLWRALIDGCARDDLVALLVESYGIEPSLAATDVDAFVAEMARLGLLEEADADPDTG